MNTLYLDIHAVKTCGPDNREKVEKAALRLVTKSGTIFTTAWMESGRANELLKTVVDEIRGGEIKVIK